MDGYREMFTRLFEAVAACESPKGTQVDDVLGEFQQAYDATRRDSIIRKSVTAPSG